MSQRRLFSLLTFLVLITLLLAACERPLPGSGDDTDNAQTTTDPVDNSTSEDTTSGAAEDSSTVEESASEDAAETTEGEGAAEDTDTPRSEDDAEGAYPAEEGYPAEEDATGEQTAEEADSSGEESTGSEEAATDEGETQTNEEGETATESEATEEAAAEEGEGEGEGESDTEATDGTDENAAEESGEETADSGAVEEESNAGDAAAEQVALPDTHTIGAGENLYRIGLQYGISWVALAQHNNISDPNKIVVGQVLNLPGGGTDQPATDPEPTPSPQTEEVYTVQAGDNLYRIGLAYQISWTQIAEANGIVNPNQITAGQQLKIPVDKPSSGQQSFVHTVQPNETLFLISLRYGVAWPVVAEENELESPHVIFPGQTLVIPGK